MEGKKNLCAMISTDLHGKIMAEKEQLKLNTLAEYGELCREPTCSIKAQDKGPVSFPPRTGHKAPQCGAFQRSEL